MSRCLISFGANIGNAYKTIVDASSSFQDKLNLNRESYRLSRLFKTPPVGGPVGQPPFVNAVAAFESSKTVWEIWEILRGIEADFGRERNQRWEARRLDMDVLLFGDQKIWTPQFKIPHPRMSMRRFILMPACDVASDWIDPVSLLSVSDLSKRLQTRPASLLLAGEDHQSTSNLLIEVARQARARWRNATVDEQDAIETPTTGERWLSHCAGNLEEVESEAKRLNPSLVVVLTEPVKRSNESRIAISGEAWEDRFRSLAGNLSLCRVPDAPTWDLAGPRYLLDSADPKWAIHELVSAFDAMDCPVESY